MNQKENENVKISVRDLIMRYIRYLPLIVISISIALIFAYAYLRYTTPLYSARATLLIKTDKSSPKMGGEFDEVYFSGGRGNLNSEVEVLMSLSLAKRVAASLGLQKKSYVKGNIKTTLNYPAGPLSLQVINLASPSQSATFDVHIVNDREFTLGQEGEKKYAFGQPFQYAGTTFSINKNDSLFKGTQYKEQILTWEPLESAAFGVLGGLSVAPTKDQSNILAITYLSPDPVLAKDIINQLMNEYSKLNVEDKNQTASRTISFINERLNLITRELGDVEKDLQKYKQENNVINLSSQSEIFLNNQSEIDKQISELEVKQRITTFLQEYIGDQKNEHEIVPTSLGIDDNTLAELITQYNQFQLKLDAQLKTTTASNVTVKVLEGQLEKLRSDLLENLKNLKTSQDLQLNSMKQKNQQYNSKINSVPIKEKELLEITRQQGIKQNLYLFLLQKREETAISLAATVSNSQIVDGAIASGAPVKPSPGSIKLMAIFLGLVIPIGIIYVKELLNDKVGSRPDITRITDAPIFGEIGHSQDKEVLMVRKNKRDVVTEQFRMVRTNIQYMISNTSNPVILVTSTFSGEGKSFVSINTGAVMALAGKKTVVLEFDIRKPKISKSLDLSRAKGISNFLVSDIPVSSLPQQVPGVDNLYIVACGPIPPNPSEILLNEKMNELFAYLKQTFDVVIIDTAPVGLVSDAYTLGKYADSTLYIVRMGYTLKKQLHFIEELYNKNKLPKIGLLVNDIKASSHYYGYGNYGGYGYGYGYGYGQSNGYYESGSNGNGKIGKLFKRIVKSKK
ncbi:GumC family protein [Niastella sp. OAS944]|uniref:GumC family protein n=1 Tax=Niastella sp. OAS944 TaxID=2664089 RepID=UPI0034793A01|nr:capsular exopolysaccharide synthesis family protein [Chitinophagaceae bacterium OAS944]